MLRPHCVGPQTHTQETHTLSVSFSPSPPLSFPLPSLSSKDTTTSTHLHHHQHLHHHRYPYPLPHPPRPPSLPWPLAAFRAICLPALNPLLHPFSFSRSNLSPVSSLRLQISRKMLCQRKLLFIAEKVRNAK